MEASSKMDESTRNVIGHLRGSPPVRWLLLRGGRLRVAMVLLVVMAGVVFVNLLLFRPLLDGARMRWLFNGLVNGLLSLITIVLTINQLILSRQFGSPKDLFERLSGRIDFRETVEDESGAVITPSQTGGFVAVLFRSLRGYAKQLETVDGGGPEPNDLDALRDEYVDTIMGQADRITQILEEEPFEMTGLLAVLNYDDSWQFYTTRRLQNIYADALSERESELLENIRNTLKQIDTARQYFKTLYLQRELAQLSRHVVYMGIISIVVSSTTLLVFQNYWTLSLSYLANATVLTLLFALTILPVVLLFSYALRLATVTRRTVIFGPFTPQEEQLADSDWHR